MNWIASPQTDEDLIAGRDYIQADNDEAALAFLDAAFETFDRLAQFPEMGARVRLKASALKNVRFIVLPPPYSRWIVFYEPKDGGVYIRRVLCGNMDWRGQPKRFF